MVRRWWLSGLLLLLAWRVEAAPDQSMSFATASSGATITASEHNTVRNETASKFNVHTHTDISQVGSTLNVGSSSGGTSISSAGSIVLEGSTTDDFETTVTPTDPTADRTITLPNTTGTVLLNTDIANQVLSGASPLVLEGSSADDSETTITVTDPTADRTITVPDASGTLAFESAITWKATNSLSLDLSTQADVAFTDLDLTSVTSASATVAFIQVLVRNTTDNEYIQTQFRKNGDTPTVPIECNSQDEGGAANVNVGCFFAVGLDSGQVMEYFINVESASTGVLQLAVVGYWPK